MRQRRPYYGHAHGMKYWRMRNTSQSSSTSVWSRKSSKPWTTDVKVKLVIQWLSDIGSQKKKKPQRLRSVGLSELDNFFGAALCSYTYPHLYIQFQLWVGSLVFFLKGELAHKIKLPLKIALEKSSGTFNASHSDSIKEKSCFELSQQLTSAVSARCDIIGGRERILLY